MFKYLGFWVQYDLKQNLVIEQVDQKLKKWLDIIDSAELEGRMKAWIINFHVCAKLTWALMVQNWLDTTATKWQALIHRKYRDYMGLAAPAEASILYRSRNHFGIQLKNLAEMQRQLRIVKWHIMKNSTVLESRKLYHYRHSLDQKGKIGQGRKTSPCLTLERLERSQAVDSLSALGQHGRQGLGFGRKKRKICSRAEIIDRLKKEMEEKRLVVLHKYDAS
jgi:hypothetical protein